MRPDSAAHARDGIASSGFFLFLAQRLCASSVKSFSAQHQPISPLLAPNCTLFRPPKIGCSLASSRSAESSLVGFLPRTKKRAEKLDSTLPKRPDSGMQCHDNSSHPPRLWSTHRHNDNARQMQRQVDRSGSGVMSSQHAPKLAVPEESSPISGTWKIYAGLGPGWWEPDAREAPILACLELRCQREGGRVFFGSSLQHRLACPIQQRVWPSTASSTTDVCHGDTAGFEVMGKQALSDTCSHHVLPQHNRVAGPRLGSARRPVWNTYVPPIRHPVPCLPPGPAAFPDSLNHVRPPWAHMRRVPGLHRQVKAACAVPEDGVRFAVGISKKTFGPAGLTSPSGSLPLASANLHPFRQKDPCPFLLTSDPLLFPRLNTREPAAFLGEETRHVEKKGVESRHPETRDKHMVMLQVATDYWLHQSERVPAWHIAVCMSQTLHAPPIRYDLGYSRTSGLP